MFYLLESFKHMAARSRARTNPSSHFIYHKALIKLIIENQLAKIGWTWSRFIFWGGFQHQPIKRKRGKPQTAKRGREQKIKLLLSPLPAKKT